MKHGKCNGLAPMFYFKLLGAAYVTSPHGCTVYGSTGKRHHYGHGHYGRYGEREVCDVLHRLARRRGHVIP